MKSIFEIFIPRNTFRPPRAVVLELKKNFGNVMNVEWSKEEDFYEAVFYHLNTEKIARFTSSGELIEIKINLPLSAVKPEIASQALAVGVGRGGIEGEHRIDDECSARRRVGDEIGHRVGRGVEPGFDVRDRGIERRGDHGGHWKLLQEHLYMSTC